MSNTTVIKVTEQEIKELDIMCFFVDQLESGTGLEIIIYSPIGRPRKINVQKGFHFTVENNKIEIFNKDKEKKVFKLNMKNFDFLDLGEHIKFYHDYQDYIIKIAKEGTICEEEESMCIIQK